MRKYIELSCCLLAGYTFASSHDIRTLACMTSIVVLAILCKSFESMLATLHSKLILSQEQISLESLLCSAL